MKPLTRLPAVQRLIGLTLAELLRFVRATNRLIRDPQDADARYGSMAPMIAAFWHGQHFLMPFSRPDGHPVSVMISRSADGEINAIAARRLGLGLIRASGGRTAHQIKKRGGARGFLEALRTLDRGTTVALTADVPKGPARRAGEGVVLIASRAARPILPIAITTSNRFTLASTWDRSTVNLPFGRMAIVYAEPIAVPADLSPGATARWQAVLESSLDRAHVRADALCRGEARPVPPGGANAVPVEA